MEIVIEIGNEHYERIMRLEEDVTVYPTTLALYEAVKNGTPLPEHHGRLIDADELYGDFIDGTEGYDCQTWNRIEIGDIIEDAPTIIEAEGSDSE